MCRCTSVSLFVVLVLTLVVMTFTGCAHNASDPLTYQPRAAVVSGELSTPTGIFYVTITLSSEADDSYIQSGRGGVITFSFSPSTGSSDADGMIAEVSPNGVYITYPDGSGTKIPLSKKAGKRYYDIMSIFSLDPKSLYSVSTSGGTTTALYSGENSDIGVEFSAGEETPRKIYTIDGSFTLTIGSYRFIDTDISE
ncbi:MAG TPA: hypothetical protein PLZ27_04490 [Bacillota bacterium]|nr:hypothetical protein [Clostridiales bacterium]HPU17912.1 hypothetical protein [Bacillota bacterium]